MLYVSEKWLCTVSTSELFIMWQERNTTTSQTSLKQNYETNNTTSQTFLKQNYETNNTKSQTFFKQNYETNFLRTDCIKQQKVPDGNRHYLKM